jgi:hypothetical protein
VIDAGSDIQRRFDIGYSRGNRIVLGLLGMGPRCSRVELGDTELHVRMGWGFDARIPLANVTRVGPADRPFFAWGVHGWRGRWLVNGSSEGIVAVEIDPPVRGRTLCCFPLRLRTVYVSLTDPDALIAAVGASPHP